MKKSYFLFIILFAFAFLLSNKTAAQQIIDSSDVIYVDNTSDGNASQGVGTFMDDPKYKEFPQTQSTDPDVYGWWQNTGATYYYGGVSRRASYYGSGNNTGAHANFYCTVHKNGYYLVYHNMYSGNATTDAYVTFTRFGENAPADSFRYNEQYNITPEGLSSWYPLDIIELFAGDSSLTVDIGLDSVGGNTLRTDAVALLKSSQNGPDLEFGARRFTRLVVDANTQDTTLDHSFYRDRAPFQFQPTTFNSHSDKSLRLFNLGSAPLTITGFDVQTSRFSIVDNFPITIQPGGKKDVTVRFSPLGEETTMDTLTLLSNDQLEPEASLPLTGEGINYNFIMNASLDGSEPHYNIEGAVFSTIGSGWLNSTASPFTFPIPEGNKKSIVNTGAQAGIAGLYTFQLPDAMFGTYYIEYGGPYSGNAADNSTVEVVTPFIADTQKVTGFNENLEFGGPKWSRIGGNKVFELNGGGETVVKFTNPGSAFLRLDLLRVRRIPKAPDISTDIDPARLLNFGSVSVYDSIRLSEYNYQKGFTIGSNGETPLVIDSIKLSVGTTFSIDNMPNLPLSLPAIDGQYNLMVSYLPENITLGRDTIRIYSNDPQDSVIVIRLSGQGVGTGITVDNGDPTTYTFPGIVDYTGAPDPENMDKWYRVSGSGINSDRLFTYIYFNPSDGEKTVEWFPNFPFKPGSSTAEPDSFDVFIETPTSSSISSPVAKYLVKSYNGVDTVIVNQNSTIYGGDVTSSGRVSLGRYIFLRGGQDSYGSGTVFGSVQLLNDTSAVTEFYKDSLVNTARVDSFVLRADALILEQAGAPVSVTMPSIIPSQYELSQNYPNPFNPTTQINYSLPKQSLVQLKVYDILGREVATLFNGEQQAGRYTLEWNGNNNFGSKVASGIYIYRIVAGKFVKTKKMMLLK